MRATFLASVLMLGLTLGLTAPALAQTETPAIDVSIAAERTVGYFLGDPIRHHVEIVAPAGTRFVAASLPRPRKISYWLDLISVTPTETTRGGRAVLGLDLVYQSFYAPIEARQQLIPGFRVGLTGAGGTEEAAKVPAWRFTMSPLRELTAVGAATEGSPIELAPPLPPALPSTASARTRLTASAVALVAIGLGLAWHYGRFPFHARAARPFGRARRVVARALGQDRPAEAFTAVHRALDATFRARLLSEDLDRLVAAEPAFAGARERLATFFAASHSLFYGDDIEGARALMPDRDLLALVGALAAAERVR
jgi:mxaA protein